MTPEISVEEAHESTRGYLPRVAMDFAAQANGLLAGIEPNSRRRTEVGGKSYTIAEVIAMAQVLATLADAVSRLALSLSITEVGEAAHAVT